MQSVYTTREKILLGTIAGYLLLNQGFTQLRMPPVGPGIPIGEFVLAVSFLGVSIPKIVVRLNRVLWVLPFLIWWVYGIARALAGVPQYGPWALRDASQVIDSLFLVIGFALATNPAKLDRFFHWFYLVFFVGGVYALTFPAEKFLAEYSPHITAAAGYSVPLLFSYTNSATLLMTAAPMLVLLRGPYPRGRMRYLWAALFLMVPIAVMQSRTAYVLLISVPGFFLIFHRKILSKWMLALSCALLLLVIVFASGIEIKGRLGQRFSPEFVAQHFSTLSGTSENTELSGAAAGIGQRIGWWRQIGTRLTRTPASLIFGLGYGMPLVDFTLAGGMKVREPHNSYISVLARLGVLGALLWTCMHVTLFWTWLSGFRLARRRGWKVDEARLLVLALFCFVVLLTAIGEDAMEKTFNTAPYYFFWSVVVAYVSHLRALAARIPDASEEPFPLDGTVSGGKQRTYVA